MPPSYPLLLQFACGDMDVCMLTDSLLGSHPVEVPIINPKEIEQVTGQGGTIPGDQVQQEMARWLLYSVCVPSQPL